MACSCQKNKTNVRKQIVKKMSSTSRKIANRRIIKKPARLAGNPLD